MAKESKIGLLLGLVIIFVIAFVLNGLPQFGEATDGEPPIDPVIEEPSGIGANERDHIDTSIPPEPAARQTENGSIQDNSEESLSYASLPAIQPIPPEPNEEPRVSEEDLIKQTISKLYYVVSEGDNLADIAKKFYGPIEGNKRANVLRIFLANRDVLESPHLVRVGQKLVIPRLTSDSDEITIGNLLPKSFFEKVKSIGMRHLPSEKPEPKEIKEYVVREGDNLWDVAAAQLGDPTRYKEICKLNAERLEDENTLSVGMRLYLPAQ